jgi:hypothetical protein
MYAMDSKSSLLLCSMPRWLLMLEGGERERKTDRESEGEREEEREGE